MAKVYGWYRDETGDPTRIAVNANPKENDRLRDLPTTHHPYPGVPDDPTITTHVFPADKQTMGEIARRVEVDCDDARLIDWMAGKSGGA